MSTVTFRHHFALFDKIGVFWTPVGFVSSNGVVSREKGGLVNPEATGLGADDCWTTWTLEGSIMKPGDQWKMQLPKRVAPGDVYSNNQADLKIISVEESWFDKEQGTTLANCVVELISYNQDLQEPL